MGHIRNEPEKSLASRFAVLQEGEKKKRRKRESPEEENVLNIQLAVFIDRSLVNSIHPWFYGEAKIGQVIKNMTEVLVESVELQLNHRTLGQNFTIEIVHLETGISLPGLEEEIDWRSRDLDVASLSELYLKTFCPWQSKQKIPGQRHWDYAVLLTGPGLYSRIDGSGRIGLSFQGGMCKEVHSCSVMFDQHKLFDGVEISEQGLDKSARTMAHELVHTMGVSHDGQEGNYDCVGFGRIMGPMYFSGATEWSACSKRSLARFVNSYASGCLRDDSPPTWADRWLRLTLAVSCPLIIGCIWIIWTYVDINSFHKGLENQ